MGKYTLSLEEMQLIALFEKATGARCKDCIQREKMLYFIVEENEIGKAVGKAGANVHRLEEKLNRTVRMIEFHPDEGAFLKSLMYPAQIDAMEKHDGVVYIVPQDLKSRGLMIGKNAQNLRFFESVVKRYFDTVEIKIKG